MNMRFGGHAALGLVVTLAIAGCGDSKTDVASASADAKPTSTAAPAASKPKSNDMPPVTVDDEGPYINGERANLKDDAGKKKLHDIVAALPINGKEVTLIILQKAKVPDVTAVIHELGLAGAPTIRVSDGEARKDVPKELVITPKVPDKVDGCAIVAMVEKDMSTAVWSIKGGIGKKHDKGLAGPDLGNTGETLEKELKKCSSTVAFFAAAPTLNWELAHDIGGSVMVNDKEKKIATLVFLEEAPVPGREVTLPH